MSKYDIAESDMNNMTELGVDAIDALISSLDIAPFLEVFPIFRAILVAARASVNYTDMRIKYRLVSFLKGIGTVGEDELNDFIRTTASDEEKTGQRMVDALYDMESNKKAALAGRVYRYCLLNKYDLDAFYRILSCINRVYYEDLFVLSRIKNLKNSQIANDGNVESVEIIDGLYASGLLSNKGTGSDVKGGRFVLNDGLDIFGLNKYGEAIAAVLES